MPTGTSRSCASSCKRADLRPTRNPNLAVSGTARRMRRPMASEEPDEQDAAGLELVLDHLRDTRAFDFTGYKRATLDRRIRKRMSEMGVATFEGYVDFLEVHPEEFEPLFNTILINVTSFFRDVEAWDAVRTTALPELLAHKPVGPIRIWSAGCSTGQEAYSALM